MSRKCTLAELAKLVGGTVRGDAGLGISGVNAISDARPGQITWASDERYRRELETSQAAAVVVAPQFGATPMPAILVEDPELAFVRIISRFAPEVPRPPVGRDPTAVIAENATIGEQVAIGPGVVIRERARIGRGTVLHANVFVGDDTQLGEDCEIWPGVVIRERCRLGHRVMIHANTSIGADGFGFHFAEGRHHKIPQIGTVVIEDDVEIGANSSVDRAKLGETRIGTGTKIDDQVMVAHNVHIGAHCVLAGKTALSGSTDVGNFVVFGGRAGTFDHVSIGDRTIVTGCATTTKNTPADRVVGGFPAINLQEHLREQAYVRRLPGIDATLKDLVRRVQQLESAANDQSAG